MNILARAFKKFHRTLLGLFDRPFSRTITVRDASNTKLFDIYNYGETCRARAYSFSYKEPETIDWINSFEKGDSLLDVGANIGIYSLYASSLGVKTYCIEPDSQNFALLNMNIFINGLDSHVQAYSVALNDKQGYSKLNLMSMEWGGALSSFCIQADQFQRTFTPQYAQGCYGDTMDSFVSKVCPRISHVKIDVDGNENLILRGGINTLRLSSLKSVLVELDETRSDYQSSINLLEISGLRLLTKTHSPMFDNTRFSSTYNHIFIR